MPHSVRDRPQHFSFLTTARYCRDFLQSRRKVRLLRDRRSAGVLWALAVVGCFAWAGDIAPALAQSEPVPTGVVAPAAEQIVPPLMDNSPIPTKNLLQVLRDGGPMMIPILVCSFLLLVFVFERAVSLRRGRVIPGPFVQRFLTQLRDRELDRDTAWELCEENRSPVSEVFGAAVKKWGRPSVEVEQAVIDAGERVTNGLRKYLRLFNGICTISPMLGLLGTVFGMISSFNSIATSNAMGRPDLLASGIGEALLTTAAGLCVAIPAMVTYLYFVSRVDQLIISIDSLSQEVVELIASDTWHKEDEEKPKRRLKAA
jgi:biopolymer transport protein ExbB